MSSQQGFTPEQLDALRTEASEIIKNFNIKQQVQEAMVKQSLERAQAEEAALEATETTTDTTTTNNATTETVEDEAVAEVVAEVVTEVVEAEAVVAEQPAAATEAEAEAEAEAAEDQEPVVEQSTAETIEEEGEGEGEGDEDVIDLDVTGRQQPDWERTLEETVAGFDDGEEYDDTMSKEEAELVQQLLEQMQSGGGGDFNAMMQGLMRQAQEQYGASTGTTGATAKATATEGEDDADDELAAFIRRTTEALSNAKPKPELQVVDASSSETSWSTVAAVGGALLGVGILGAFLYKKLSS